MAKQSSQLDQIMADYNSVMSNSDVPKDQKDAVTKATKGWLKRNKK